VPAGNHNLHALDDTRLAPDTVAGVPPPLELVIFDCDGVLVDSEPLASELELERFAELGIPMTAAEIAERFMGRSIAYVNAAIAEHLGGPVPAERERYWECRYRALLTERLRPIPGVAQALEQITLPVCVASSSGLESIAFKLSLCGLAERFGDRIFSATQVRHGKPAPDLFLLAAERMQADPSRCAVVEDSSVGVQAGRAAAMRTFAYAGGGLVARDRLDGDATIVFDDMRLLPELLERATRPGGSPD
jgi:HAD superfamily hydrolase (TIGR01509 family)